LRKVVPGILNSLRKHPFPPPVTGECVEQPVPREMGPHWTTVALLHHFGSEVLRDYNLPWLVPLWVHKEQNIIPTQDMYCFQLWHLLPSSVKVMFSLGGPYPAEVLALTEMLYGMYIPAQMSNIKLQVLVSI